MPLKVTLQQLASGISLGASQSNSAMLHLFAWDSSNCNSALCCAQLCPTLCDHIDCSLPVSSVHEDSPGKNTGMGCHALLTGALPNLGIEPGLPHCRWILYQLSHKGTPTILEWVAYHFFRGSFQPRNQTGVSYIAGGFFTS